MFLDISKPFLEVVRGDTFYLPIALNSGTREYFEPYLLDKDDALYIGIMRPGQPFEDAIIRCKLDQCSPRDSFGNSIFKLTHDDTKNLEPGKYYITIKFVSGEDVTTLTDQKLFYVTGSTTCCRGV